MMLYLLEPEVAGGKGENTKYDEEKNVIHLEYEFYGWLGDELIEATPCFVVTDILAKDIQTTGLTGCQFREIEVSLNEQFYDLNPQAKTPPFGIQLLPLGSVLVDNGNTVFEKWSGEDFCFSDTRYLVVSERALSVLKKHKMNYCEVTELKEK